jgi:hypothetical protein
MPHTRTVRDIGTLYAFPIHIQGMSAFRHPTVLKTYTFSCKDNENTFNMSAIYPIALQN